MPQTLAIPGQRSVEARFFGAAMHNILSLFSARSLHSGAQGAVDAKSRGAGGQGRVSKGNAVPRMSLSKLLLVLCSALVIAGCHPRSAHVRPIPVPPTLAKAPQAPLFVAEAEAALARSDFAASMSFAELAVRALPDDARPRTILAQAYLGGGRMVAAAQSYGDLLAQTPGDSKARLGRALARLAGGDRSGAIDDLNLLDTAGVNPDIGLAYALAGDSVRGLAILTRAARSEAATPRIRQNLALAFALDGQWTQARAVAAQDLDSANVDARIHQWTSIAANRDPASRTAAVLAVVPNSHDSGRPAELAWVTAEKQQAALPAVAPFAQVTVEAPAEAVATPTPVADAVPEHAGRWVVQLGAYAREAQRDAAWARVKSGKSSVQLSGYEPIASIMFSPERGRLHRLSVGTFADRPEADQLCTALRQVGTECLVRDVGQVGATQLAARY